MTGYRSLVLRSVEWKSAPGATEEHTIRATIERRDVTIWRRSEITDGDRVIVDDGPAIVLHRDEMAALVAIWQEATA